MHFKNNTKVHLNYTHTDKNRVQKQIYILMFLNYYSYAYYKNTLVKCLGLKQKCTSVN